MARIIILLTFVLGAVVILNLRDYNSSPVAVDRFDFQKLKKSKEEKQKVLDELARAKEEKDHKVAVDAKPSKSVFVVELTTDELRRGHDLYKKCIICHGKSGQGKKSQKAPAVGGQFDWYIKKSIIDMQKGARVNNAMEPYIRNLSAQDITDLSAYISKLKWRSSK